MAAEQYSDDLCCELTLELGEGDACEKLPGGIEDIRIGCLKYFCEYSVGDCAVDPTLAYVDAITVQDPVTALAVVPLFRATIKKKTGQHIWALNYDDATDTNKVEETISFDITAIGTAVRCALLEYRGQEVIVFFKYRGSDKWYTAGWQGGLRITAITGGSGLDARVRTAFTITGTDLDAFFIEVFDTDVVTTDALVDALTN